MSSLLLAFVLAADGGGPAPRDAARDGGVKARSTSSSTAPAQPPAACAPDQAGARAPARSLKALEATGTGGRGSCGATSPKLDDMGRVHGAATFLVLDEGALDRKAVEQVVKARYGVFRACYEARLKANPALRGRLSLVAQVSATGSVGTVVIVDDTARDAALADCVRLRAAQLTFPPSASQTQLMFAVAFLPEP